MPLFEYPQLAFTQIALIVISARWMLRRNDELPLLLSFLLFYVSSFRYWAVANGFNIWVNLEQFGLAPVTNQSATDALQYIVLGQLCTVGTYMLRQKLKIPVVDRQYIGFSPFLNWLRPKVILFGVFCLPLVIVAQNSVKAQLAEGRSAAFQISSYLQQFPLILTGIATLLLCLWKVIGMPLLREKIATIIILYCITNFSFNISGRFQFIGWLATAGIILSSSYKSKTRLIILALAAVVGLGIFGVAGTLRGTDEIDQQAAWHRLFSAEDANMLDGFALLKDAFPRLVPFRLGMAHLEILMRPIPRAIWPEKPVGGGYLAEVGLVDPETGSTLGFSPTFYGDFYSEGGIFGILFFAPIYGAILAAIVQRSAWLHPFAGVLIRAILCSSMVPLLRGGDLPGIFAWIGMSFWPCFLLLWLRRKEFKWWPGFFYRNGYNNPTISTYSD
ncbi:MAG: oligosaccharide repeat unit polymerase [Fischerella sp. CENA71]|nr:oligosaccharide repeat unit polymerase [Fischerella sp. CENA71]